MVHLLRREVALGELWPQPLAELELAKRQRRPRNQRRQLRHGHLHRAAGITPVVHKVACGAVQSVPVFTVTNLARALRLLKEKGIWLYGASDDAPQDVFAMDLPGPLALVLGAEGKGLRRLTAELCDFRVAIPMAGVVESLNVSVAAGVLLYEARRQRMLGDQG